MNVLSPDARRSVMNKNVLIVLGVAVLAAVLVAKLVQVTMGDKKKPAVVSDGVEVLVAAKDLKIGQELGEGDMEWKKWPEGTLFKGAIIRKEERTPNEALEGRLDRSFARGEAMVRRGILKETKGNVVAARLKPGERAVSIRVDEEDVVSGFIMPGNYVDVILTYDERLSFGKSNASRGDDEGEQEVAHSVNQVVTMNYNGKASETIMQNIRVLAINQTTDQEADEEDGKKKKAKKLGKRATATLAVPIKAAEELALASEMGNITLAMRGVGDDAVNEKTPATTDARLISIDDELFAEFKRMQEEHGSGGARGKVKIYNGGVLEEVTVK